VVKILGGIKMAYRNFTIAEDGFAGYMVLPDQRSQLAVITLMPNDMPLPVNEIADSLAKEGYISMNLPLYGQKGQAKTANCLPIEPIEQAISYLRERLKVAHIVLYGFGIGTVTAVYGAYYIEDIDGVILVSPTHVCYAGVGSRNRLTGHSLMTYKDEELPFLTVDFKKHRSYDAFTEAYEHRAEVELALLPIERLKSQLLILAGDSDEVWPSAYSLKKLEYCLYDGLYPYPYQVKIFHNASHYIGYYPGYFNPNSLLRLPQMASMVERRYNRQCQDARRQSKQMILDFLTSILK